MNEVEMLRLQFEGPYDPNASSMCKELQRFARCSPGKAAQLYAMLKLPKRETFDAWKKWELSHGTIATIGAMSGHSHPDEVRENIPAPPMRKSAVAAAKELQW